MIVNNKIKNCIQIDQKRLKDKIYYEKNKREITRRIRVKRLVKIHSKNYFTPNKRINLIGSIT